MQGVAPTLVADTVPDGASTSEPAEVETALEPKEAACETLYIQNLNEGIKLPGGSSLSFAAAAPAYLMGYGRKG
jgi:hypothetical protein